MSCSTWWPATTWRAKCKCLANDGRLAIIAVQGGTKSEIDTGVVLRKRLSITGSTLRARSIDYKAQLARALREQVWPLLEAGRIKPVIHQVFPAAQAAEAHALMESSTHVGKIVLDWKIMTMRRNSSSATGRCTAAMPANAELLAGIAGARPFVADVAVCVPFPYLSETAVALAGTDIRWGAQDCSAHEQGAYTGEVSAAMLHEFGCRYAIVGHSERRAVPRRERSAGGRQGQGRARARHHADRLRRRNAGAARGRTRPKPSSSASSRP